MNLETYCRNRRVELWEVLASIAHRFRQPDGSRTYNAKWLADNVFNGCTRPERKSADDVYAAHCRKLSIPQCVHREALLYLGDLGLINPKGATR